MCVYTCACVHQRVKLCWQGGGGPRTHTETSLSSHPKELWRDREQCTGEADPFCPLLPHSLEKEKKMEKIRWISNAEVCDSVFYHFNIFSFSETEQQPFSFPSSSFREKWCSTVTWTTVCEHLEDLQVPRETVLGSTAHHQKMSLPRDSTAGQHDLLA